MPGSLNGEVVDTYFLHPKCKEIDIYAEQLYPQILQLLKELYGDEKVVQNTELVVEAATYTLVDWLP